jgi:very-short-patch-repair endonuclease
MSSLLAATVLPPMIPEHVVRDVHGGFLAVVDFAYPDRRIAVEVDGYEAHSGRRAVRRDKARDRALMDAKWIPLHFDWEQVDKRHPIVAREIGKWYQRRRELGISAR